MVAGEFYAICMLLRGTETLEPAMFPSICPSEFLVGGMKKPSIYTPCWGLNLKGMCAIEFVGDWDFVGCFGGRFCSWCGLPCMGLNIEY